MSVGMAAHLICSGFYVVSFFKHGRWVEVIIDDRLLVLGGKHRNYTETKLMFGSTINHEDPTVPGNQLWVPLLEKAYAKLHGTMQLAIGSAS